MKLRYHISDNFGDALNPIIFGRFLPGFFDEDPETFFLGIGSILGFKLPGKEIRKIVFSSGFAQGDTATYGKAPVIDKSFDVICVRGPLTADVLGLPREKAVTDGAALLRKFEFPPLEKAFPVSYMPHIGSEVFFDWAGACDKVGFHYISPRQNPMDIIRHIRQTEMIICEAMHGAIVADTLRVPWIPLKAYTTINEFKWRDWAASMNLDYHPHRLRSLYSREFLQKISRAKFLPMPSFFHGLSSTGYKIFQDVFFSPGTLRSFTSLQNEKPFLSEETVLDERVEELLRRLETVKAKYGKSR